MRYTRYALHIFGVGAVLGLLLVAANLPRLGIAASALMAAALLYLPAALVVDWWAARPWRQTAAKPRKRSPRRQPAARAKASPPRRRGVRDE